MLKGERPVLSPFFIFYRIIRREESLMMGVGATKVEPTVPPLYSGSWRQKHKLKIGKDQCLIYNSY